MVLMWQCGANMVITWRYRVWEYSTTTMGAGDVAMSHYQVSNGSTGKAREKYNESKRKRYWSSNMVTITLLPLYG